MTLDDSPIPPLPDSPGADPSAIPATSIADITFTQDLRVPWTWLDIFLLAVIFLVGSAICRLLLLAVFAKYGFTGVQIAKSPALFGLFSLIQQLLITVALLVYLIAQLRVNFRAPFWRTIGWRPFEPGALPTAVKICGWIAAGFVMAFVVQSVTLRFASKTKLPVQALFQDRRVALGLMLMAVFVAPAFEETIFRGYIYPVVARTYGMAVGVFGTGILFGLMHAAQLWGGWLQIGLIIIVGILLTYARAATRTVFSSFLLHVSYNFFVSFGLVLLAPWYHFISHRH
jgi:membrane protease YdiL (CAAX protease family)